MKKLRNEAIKGFYTKILVPTSGFDAKTLARVYRDAVETGKSALFGRF